MPRTERVVTLRFPPEGTWETSRIVMVSGMCVLAVIGMALGSGRYLQIGLAVPVVALALWGLLKAPAAFVLGVTALRPMVDSVVHLAIGGLSLGQWWAVGLLGSLGVYWILEGYRRPLYGKGWLIAVAFPVAYATSTLGRDAMTLSGPQSVKLALWALLALTCGQIASTAHGQRMLVRAITVTAVLTVVVMGYAVATDQYGSAYYASGQFAALGQGPHGLASLGVLASTVVWMNASRGRARWRWMVLAALLGVGVSLSLVRTTFLAFALIMVWFLIASVRARRRGAIAAAWAAVTAVGATVYVFRDTLLGRVSDLALLSAGGSLGLAAGSGRIGIWRAVLRAATSGLPALLIGQGSLASMRATAISLGTPLWAHNDFLEFMITGGVGLLALYVALMAWLFWSMTRLARDARQSTEVREAGALFAVVVVAYVFMAFVNGMAFYEASMIMAVIVGLAQGMRRTPGHTFIDE